MRFGLPQSTIDRIHEALARFPEVETAILYGSRAKGNYKPGSDIDITLRGTDLTHDHCSRIAGDLDDLMLPHTIDLSIFDLLDHAGLREHIERVGKVFYERADREARGNANARLGPP